MHLFAGGIILSLIFLVTKNIFFVTIFHAFFNFSLPVVNSPASFEFYLIAATVIIALL